MKTISLFLALINSLLAGLIVAFSLSPGEPGQVEMWRSFARMALACSVMGIGILTWLGSARSIHTGTAALSSLYLVALGAAIVVWTFHLALVSGEVEFYRVIYGGSLAVQGMASLFGFATQDPLTAT